MVIIRPTPTPSQPMKNDLHMDNLYFIEDIRAVRMCTNMPPEPTDFDVKRPHVLEETEKGQHANSTYQQARYENHQEEDVDKTYLDFDVKRLRVLEETKEEQHADSTHQQTMYEKYKEEDVDKNYPEMTAEREHTTNDGPLNKGVPRETGTTDIARRSTVSKAASEMGEPDVEVVPGAAALKRKTDRQNHMHFG
jgi:hypothetical protein